MYFILIDIDECDNEIHNCLPSQLCRNTIGGFECYSKCAAGLKSAENGSCIGKILQ